MSYRDPGVYLSAVTKSRGVLDGIQTLPCIIGPGARKKSSSEVIVKGTDTKGDLLPYSSVTSIKKISEYDGGPAKWVVSTDFTLSVSAGKSYIKWLDSKGPSTGESYYVTMVYDVEETQYELRLIQSKEAVKSYYGEDLRVDETDSPVNLLVTGANLAFDNGASNVYMLQVKSVGEVPTKAEFDAAIEKLTNEARIWRIVPTVLTAEIVQSIVRHVITCSSYEERKERRTLLSTPYAGATPTMFDGVGGVLDVVGTYASGLNLERASVCYPDQATLEFSDGVRRTVGPQMMMAAFAGAEQAQKISKSRTRMEIAGFYKLGGVTMTRKQMNLLSEKGVMILIQSDAGQNLVVRHQLTTNMTTVQSREISVGAISDYCAKVFREACEQYIGKYNINSELIGMIDGTLKGKISTLVKQAIINGGDVLSIVQDEDNPDSIASSVRVLVPYPCNYIDILMYLQ